MSDGNDDDDRGLAQMNLDEAGMPVGVAVAAGIMTVLIALPFFLAGIGQMEPTEPLGGVMRVFLVLFTAPFLLIGAFLTLGGTMAAVNASVPGRAPWPFRLPLFLLERVTWQGFAAALVYGLVAAEAWALTNLPDPPLAWAYRAYDQWTTLEFISIHAMAFLGATAAVPFHGRIARRVKFASFTALTAMYLGMSLFVLEPLEAAAFVVLMVVKSGDFLFRDATPEQLVELMFRWFLMFGVFLGLNWGGVFEEGSGTYPAAVRYFAALAVLELFNLLEVRVKPGTARAVDE